MTNNVTVEKKGRLLLEFLYPGFFLGLFSTSAALLEKLRVYLCCYWGSVSEWLPWALSRTRHRVSRSKQLWRNSNTLLFSPWPVLQNIVCTSVILPTPWAHTDPPHPPTTTTTTLLLHFHSLSALMSIQFLSFSLSLCHHRIIPFFSYTKI